MRYVSTRDISKTFEFKDVFIKGLADDGGLFIPETIVKYDENEIKTAMLNANKTFASREDRKTYQDHVTSGRRQGIYFENEIPYGEDRDGDGKIDNQRRGRRK